MTWTTRHDLDELEWMVEDAMATWISDALEDGEPVPDPAGSAEDGFEVTGRLCARGTLWPSVVAVLTDRGGEGPGREDTGRRFVRWEPALPDA